MRRIGICIVLVLLFQSPLANSQEAEAIAPKADPRSETLKYGIDTDIFTLLDALSSEDNRKYDGEIEALFDFSRSAAVKERIFSYFSKKKDPRFENYSLQVLEDPWSYPKSTVALAFTYVSDLKLESAAPAVRKLLEGTNSEFRDQAIRSLGFIGSADDAAFLTTYIDGDIDGDEKQRLIVRQNVMEALGNLKAVETYDRLSEIASDQDENAYIRSKAVIAIAAMGRDDCVPLILKLYESSDPLLRGAAVTAISNFDNEASTAMIFEALRDSYYKVRLDALAAVEKKNMLGAEPSVLYRAKSDPVEAVKLKAFDVLGIIGKDEGYPWLLSIISDSKASDKIRAKAAAVLAVNDPGYVVEELVKAGFSVLKDDKKTWLRYEIGKIAAKTEHTGLFSLAQAYASHTDVTTRLLGLDIYAKNRFTGMKDQVKAIADNDKLGSLSAKAKLIMEGESDPDRVE